ncbi:MAG: hypothetical protein PWQ82_1147 [Thermosediminibacterales bacterium]|nr:hypothetical protein [Thermosediminibacterales bacterium]MDK2836138.1 hypothetical protein [Thermosediminibacterales bacterium]
MKGKGGCFVDIVRKANCLHNKLIELRRYFHQNPELSWHEYKTSNKIEEELKKLGIQTERITETGVIGYIKGAEPGRTVALRADIDAIAVNEENDIPYKSKNPGCMHACGHDAHTAMLLGAAEILAESKQNLKGCVKLIFQPAEEDITGAKTLIDKGVLNGVDGILGIHVWVHLPAGKVSLEAGPRMASADKIFIDIRGKGGHGAAPHQGVDAIVTSASVIQNLQSITSREINPFDPVVVTIGKIKGGTALNVLADSVNMEGTIRCLKPKLRNRLPDIIERIVSDTASAFRAEAETRYVQGTPVVINDKSMSELARCVMEKLYGEEAVTEMLPTMGSEDFAWYAEKIPAVFAFLGCRNEEKDAVYPHHNSRFKIDEDVLPIGSAFYAQFAIDFLNS